MSSEIGTIISTPETPSTENIHFLVTGKIHRGQFFQFTTEDGIHLGRISEIRKTNEYFHEAASVSDYQKDGTPLQERFPTEQWEFLVAEGRVLGVFPVDSSLIQRPSFPASPGTSITFADPDRLTRFLGLDQKAGVHLGDVAHQNLDARINLTRLLQKHVAILAQSGAGKSYLASVLIEELLDRSPEQGSLSVVVIDPHGEYRTLQKDRRYGDRVLVFSSEDIKIGLPSLSVSDFSLFFPDLSGAQKRELGKVLRKLHKDHGSSPSLFGMDEFSQAIVDSDIKKNVKDVILDFLGRAKALRLFDRYDHPSLSQIEPGKLVVLDLSETIDLFKKQAIAAYFARRLFEARRGGLIPPFFLLVEEAHNFAPETAKKEHAISRGVITQIAREGRKFHACLGLISQRPINLSTTALSQCNTHIILRVTNPYDLDHIGRSSEGITADVKSQIPGLRTGECIIVGEAVNLPLFVNIRKRRSQEFETGIPLEDAARAFLQDQARKEKDAEAFL